MAKSATARCKDLWKKNPNATAQTIAKMADTTVFVAYKDRPISSKSANEFPKLKSMKGLCDAH